MLLTQPAQPIHLGDGDLVDFYKQARKIARERSLSRISEAAVHSPTRSDFGHLMRPFSTSIQRHPARRRSSVKSTSSSQSNGSNGSDSPPLRLAELAKQQVMATHVDNWREDMLPVRQHLPMQHIIGSLKRDREDLSAIPAKSQPPQRRSSILSHSSPSESQHTESPVDLEPSAVVSSLQSLASLSSRRGSTVSSSADSFLDMLRTPKSHATSPEPDTDRRFRYQSSTHRVVQDIPQSALPGLNMALNLATITPDERDLFTDYTPRNLLDDPMLLHDESVKMRDWMITSSLQEQATALQKEKIIEEETEMDMGKNFDEFLNY